MVLLGLVGIACGSSGSGGTESPSASSGGASAASNSPSGSDNTSNGSTETGSGGGQAGSGGSSGAGGALEPTGSDLGLAAHDDDRAGAHVLLLADHLADAVAPVGGERLGRVLGMSGRAEVAVGAMVGGR